MKPSFSLPWLLGLCVSACGVVLLLPAPALCRDMPWCSPSEQGEELLSLAMLLPLIVSVGRGAGAGARQLIRTQQLLRLLTWLPRSAIPANLQSIAHALGIGGQIEVVRDAHPRAFCYGLLRPRIAVTTGLLGVLADDELEAVLRHERHHLQRRDPLRTLLWTIVDAACWRAQDESAEPHLQRELAADRAVIAAGQRQPLARALLKLLSHPRQNDHTASNLAISGLTVTDARIDQLVRGVPAVPVQRAEVFRRWAVPAALLAAPLLCMLVLG